ncbi:MAG: hypothetical protein SNJ78_00460 [Spirochaetales bacterium]
MKKGIGILLSILFLAFPGCEAEGVLQNSHSGPILAMVSDESNQLLFTGGKDGTVRIWKGDPLQLIKKIQVSHLPIYGISVDSKNLRIAVLESNGFTQHFLSVWDWQRGNRLYQIQLTEPPLYMQFSPQGTYLGISKPTWQSLVLYDAETGQALPYLQEGFGIVNFFLISSSENTLLSYTPSTGNLIYWNLKEGTRKATIRTLTELRSLIPLTDRYALGFDINFLFMIDLVTGETLARANIPGIITVSVDPASEEIIILHASVEKTVIGYWKYQFPSSTSTRGGLYFLKSPDLPLPNDTIQLLPFGKRLLVGLPDGTLTSAVPHKPFLSLEGKQIVEEISDLHVHQENLLVTTQKHIWIFPLSILKNLGKEYSGPFPYSSIRKLNNPYQRPLKIVSTLEGTVYLYSKDRGSNGILASLDLQVMPEVQTVKTFSSPLLGVWSSTESLYCLEQNGRISRLKLPSLTEDFLLSAADTQTLLPLSAQTLLLGKKAVGYYGSTLLSLNTTTLETVPIQIPSTFLVYNLMYQKEKNRVFILALRSNREGDTETVLYVADAEELEQSRPIAVLRTEDLEADIALDPVSSELVTTLSSGTVRKWDGSFWKSFNPHNNRASTLHTFDKWVFAINKDGTSSLWEAESGIYQGDLVFLQDGGWIILGRTGVITADPSASVNLKYFFR